MADLHGNSKFTEERRARIIDTLSRGNQRRTAAQIVGIARETLERWITRGFEDGEGEFFQFASQAVEAEAKAEMGAVDAIYTEDPKWWLARRHKDWSERTEHTGADGAPLVMNFHEPKPQERNGVPHTNGRVTVERR